MNRKIVVISIVLLMALSFAFTSATFTLAQNNAQLGVQILQIQPPNSNVSNGTSTTSGPVGMLLNLQGTCYTSNGPYQILFNGTVIASSTSDGYYVNTNFTVPAIATGTYAIRIRDVNANTDSSEQDFQVTTSYLITANPTVVQEGGSTTLTVSVTGGDPTTSYAANVTVALPSSLGTAYTTTVPMGTPSSSGGVSTTVTFPSSSLQPSNSTSDFAGVYTAYFNQSSNLAQTSFIVGFLDSATYHRGQTANIHATGYTQDAGQTATLTVTTSSGASVGQPSTFTIASDGTISGTWQVPSNAAIGSYKATITTQGTAKAIVDSQTFSINGYSVQVQTVNLAGEPVPNVSVQATDSVANQVYNSTSDTNGIAQFNLEAGPVSLVATQNGVNIGTGNITVTGDGTYKLQCQLTDLRILVQNANSVTVPSVTVNVVNSQGLNATGQTGPSGIFTLNSTLVGASYTITASLYGNVFNAGNNTLSGLAAIGSNTVVILCPTETLTLTIVSANNTPIPNAKVSLVELSNGLFYTVNADNSGTAIAQVTFGEYKMQVYDKNNILISEININAFNSTQQQIVCTSYGIKVTVSVVDFFGNPISNANVTINGPGTEHYSTTTKSDGTATFDNVIGGTLQVIAYAQNAQNTYEALSINVGQPTSVQVKMSNYVALGSALMPVSALIAVIVIIVAVALFVVLELIWRQRTKVK